MIRLGLMLMFLTISVATKAAHAGEKPRVEPLSESAFKIVLPTGWSVKYAVSWEDDVYYISDASGTVIVIDFGNVPYVAGLRQKYEEVRTTVNGEKAVEFRKDGILSDIILEPRCGHTRYAWLHRVAQDSKGADSVMAAMRSIACVNATKKLETSPSRLYR